MTIRQIWQRLTSTRYVRLLEAEIARLRAENRALLNSILGIAGVPSIPVIAPEATMTSPILPQRKDRPAAPAPPQADKPESGAPVSGGAEGKPAGNGRLPNQGRHLATPMRRRSWQQINRMLEIDSARKKPPET